MMSKSVKFGIGGEFGLNKNGGYRTKPNNCPSLGSNMLAVNSGRAALSLIGQYISKDRNKNTVLLPSYLCHSVVQPFEELGLNAQFYPLEDMLKISPATVSEYITPETSIVVTLHYFGFEQTSLQNQDVRKSSTDSILVDDRTHLLLQDLRELPSMLENQIFIYSVRKWAGFPDLAFIRCSDDDLLQALKALLKTQDDYSFLAWRVYTLILRTFYYAGGGDFFRQQSLLAIHQTDRIIDERISIKVSSSFSLLLWDNWHWEDVAERRQENYQFLLDHWDKENNNILPLFNSLDKVYIPLGFPILVPHQRDHLRQYLISKKIYPPIHWVLPENITPSKYHNSIEISKSIMTLPIDQRYSTNDMLYILDCLYQYKCNMSGAESRNDR